MQNYLVNKSLGTGWHQAIDGLTPAWALIAYDALDNMTRRIINEMTAHQPLSI